MIEFTILFLMFPLVVILVCASLLSSRIPIVQQTHSYKSKGWYLASGMILVLSAPLGWLPNTELGHRLFHQSHGEVTSIVIVIVGVITSLVVFGLGSTQPLWNKGLFRLLPIFLFLGAALAVPSVYFCMFYWPIGYLVVAPLTLVGIAFLIQRAIK